MIKTTVGIFAHVDAGKTTFSEQLLFKTQAIRTLGRVDHKNTFLDTHSIEKQRGITIFAEQAYFTYSDCQYYLIDTPGHVDFSAEMTRTIEIIDYAIVIISGLDGVRSHTETILELLADAQIPVLFFVNKLDAPHANFESCLENLAESAPQVVDFSLSKTDPSFLEAISEKDEELLTHYFQWLEGAIPSKSGFTSTSNQEFYQTIESMLAQAIMARKIMPVFKGSALKGEGIDEFLEGLSRITRYDMSSEELRTSEPQTSELRGLVYKVRYDHQNQRQTFIKLESGAIRVRDSLGDERVTEIRKHMGAKHTSVQEVGPKDVFSVIGIKQLKIGDRVGINAADRVGENSGVKRALNGLTPNMRSKLTLDPAVDVATLFQKIKILEDEDPFLKVTSDLMNRDITIGYMGGIQLEVLKTLVKERFGFEINFEAPQVVYKETIGDEKVYGCGHFEPLRHYAEVHVTLEPQEPGAGMSFESVCHPEDLAIQFVSQVRHSVLDGVLSGLLTGSELTDVRITLVTGRAHLEHTSAGDFYEATIRAVRHGLEQAQCVLLEPLYRVAVTVPNTLVGRVMTDLSSMHGTELVAESKGDLTLVHARVPVASFGDYATELMSLSSGQGRLRLQAGGYAPCHNQESVVAQRGYQKERDIHFPSSSVFCAKGKGYTVPWNEALAHMHCPVGEKYK